MVFFGFSRNLLALVIVIIIISAKGRRHFSRKHVKSCRLFHFILDIAAALVEGLEIFLGLLFLGLFYRIQIFL